MQVYIYQSSRGTEVRTWCFSSREKAEQWLKDRKLCKANKDRIQEHTLDANESRIVCCASAE